MRMRICAGTEIPFQFQLRGDSPGDRPRIFFYYSNRMHTLMIINSREHSTQGPSSSVISTAKYVLFEEVWVRSGDHSEVLNGLPLIRDL